MYVCATSYLNTSHHHCPISSIMMFYQIITPTPKQTVGAATGPVKSRLYLSDSTPHYASPVAVSTPLVGGGMFA
jgi:hypothetical protein